MWAYGPGELVSLEGRFTAREYIRVLEDNMLPTVRAMAIPDPDPIVFVQDRSPIHNARIVNEWFREHPEIILFNWPSKGCDINPTENLWGIMKSEIEFGPARENNVRPNSKGCVGISPSKAQHLPTSGQIYAKSHQRGS